jgi:isopentenyl phosphate kinase
MSGPTIEPQRPQPKVQPTLRDRMIGVFGHAVAKLSDEQVEELERKSYGLDRLGLAMKKLSTEIQQWIIDNIDPQGDRNG